LLTAFNYREINKQIKDLGNKLVLSSSILNIKLNINKNFLNLNYLFEFELSLILCEPFLVDFQ